MLIIILFLKSKTINPEGNPMTRILVCGANGQLGSSLKNISGNFPDFSFDFTDVEELNILDPATLNSYLKNSLPSYIINCAAYTLVDKAETEREKAFLLNAEAVNNLLQAAMLSHARLIHISTDYVFNGRSHIPYKENVIPDPDSVYGLSKLKGEMYLSESPKSIIIRTSWLYSGFGINFMKTVLRLSNEREEIRMVSDQVGTPTFAGDLAVAILRIIETSEKDLSQFKSGIYHFSNEGVASWYDFAKEIVDLAGLKTRVLPIETSDYPLPAPRPQYSVLNKKKIRDTFGISIRHWKEALKDCMENVTSDM
jgi:dTDP-4-dehydrorhamnose reductase